MPLTFKQVVSSLFLEKEQTSYNMGNIISNLSETKSEIMELIAKV